MQNNVDRANRLSGNDDVGRLKTQLEAQNVKIAALEVEREQLRAAVLQASYTPAAFLTEEVPMHARR